MPSTRGERGRGDNQIRAEGTRGDTTQGREAAGSRTSPASGTHPQVFHLVHQGFTAGHGFLHRLLAPPGQLGRERNVTAPPVHFCCPRMPNVCRARGQAGITGSEHNDAVGGRGAGRPGPTPTSASRMATLRAMKGPRAHKQRESTRRVAVPRGNTNQDKNSPPRGPRSRAHTGSSSVQTRSPKAGHRHAPWGRAKRVRGAVWGVTYAARNPSCCQSLC